MAEKLSCAVTRRRFFQSGARTVGAIALTCPALALLARAAPAFADPPPAIPVPNDPSGHYKFAFFNYPQLQSAGGCVRFLIQANSGPIDLYVTRVSANLAESVSSKCTHQGCTINAFDPKNQNYTCPCHGSVFAADGEVNLGPAFLALDSYEAVLQSDGIAVTVL